MVEIDMAIVIPSKNIHSKHNPKVKDNNIGRIEVAGNEIFINTGNETALSFPTIDAFVINENYAGYDSLNTTATESGGIKIKNEKFSAGGANWYNQFVDFEFEIPIGTKDVHYLYENLIIVLTRTYSQSLTTQKSLTDTFTHKNNIRSEFNFTVGVGEPTYGYLGLTPSDLLLYLDKSCTNSTEYPFYMNTPNKIKGKIAYSIGIDSAQDEDFERVLNTQITFMVKNSINVEEKKILVGQQNSTKPFSSYGNELMQTSNYGYFTEGEFREIDSTDYRYTLESVYHDEQPPYQRVLIYFKNNNLIGKTILVKMHDEQSDIWQEFKTTNIDGVIDTGRDFYFHDFEVYALLPKQLPSIETMYQKTQSLYKNGKETATIRCDISDYYNENGDKIIATDNSTSKMSFKMYDQVTPMVYGADGKDHPMSLYQDGTPKVFQVLGTKIYYDGAVWQELSLQEVDKSEII